MTATLFSLPMLLCLPLLVLYVPVLLLCAQLLAALPAARRGTPLLVERAPLAILVPAHNEASGILGTLRAIQRQMMPADRLIVVADNCSDDTAAVARAAGNVTVIERNEPGVRGKACALSFGLHWLARWPAAIVICIDADCTLGPQALTWLAHRCHTSGRPAQGRYLMHNRPTAAHNESGARSPSGTRSAQSIGGPDSAAGTEGANDADGAKHADGADGASAAMRVDCADSACGTLRVDGAADAGGALRVDCADGAGGAMRADGAGSMEGARWGAAEFAWRVKNGLRALGRERLGMACQLTGSGMAFPWTALQAVELTNHLAEDLALGLALAAHGHAPVYCHEAIIHSNFASNAEGARAQRTRWEHGHLHLLTRHAPRHLLNAIHRRDWRYASLALDLCIPPLSLLLVLTALASLAPPLTWLIASQAWPWLMLLLPLTILLLSLLANWALHGRDLLPARRLASIIIYVCGKIPLYLRRRQRDWIPTRRD